MTMVIRNVYLRPTRSPEAPEDQRAEGPDEKTGRKGEEGEDEAGGLVHAREELPRDDRRQRAIQIEVVPLEDGAERCGEDDAPVRTVDGAHGPAQYSLAPAHTFASRNTVAGMIPRG